MGSALLLPKPSEGVFKIGDEAYRVPMLAGVLPRALPRFGVRAARTTIFQDSF
jgi:hypothetical protein